GVREARVGVGGGDDESAEPVPLHGQDDPVVSRQHGGADGREDVEGVMSPGAAVARRIEGVLHLRGCHAGDRHHEPAGAQAGIGTPMATQRAAGDQTGAGEDTDPPFTATPHPTTHPPMLLWPVQSASASLTNKRSFGYATEPCRPSHRPPLTEPTSRTPTASSPACHTTRSAACAARRPFSGTPTPSTGTGSGPSPG